MKLERLANSPSTLADFFQEGLEALGAVCERTWHDRLQLVAEGPAARLWNPEGSLLETEIHFVPPEETSPRQADHEVFPGCPLTFRLAEQLRTTPVPLERGVVQPSQAQRAPTPEVAEKLWHAQFPGASRWKLLNVLLPSWHFSLLALARCELQAIDQHWTLHRVAVSLPDGQPDEALATSLDFLELSGSDTHVPWRSIDLGCWQQWLKPAFVQELAPDLVEIRQRQERYLRRELERIDAYFDSYEKELSDRRRRAHAESSKMKAEERLAAAKDEHARRRQDQIHRHEIRVVTHIDALLLLAETAWDAKISYTQKGDNQVGAARFVPRSRRWVPLPDTP